MTLESALIFTGAFLVVAASPGPGLATILSRSLSSGISAGVAVTAGLVLGDAVFLAAAIVGISAIASALGPLFVVIKYAGAAYLVWLGINTLRNSKASVVVRPAAGISLPKDVGLGLLVTLGNPKPILFYSALLPTFMDVHATELSDFALLMCIVVVISFAVYSIYMLLAASSRRFLASNRFAKRVNQATGIMLIGAGVTVAAR